MEKVLILSLIMSIGWLGCSNESAVNYADEANALPNGNSIFKKNCILCHGIDGKLQYNGAKDLSKSILGEEDRIKQITYGKGLMSPFGGILKENEIKAVAAYTRSLNPQLK